MHVNLFKALSHVPFHKSEISAEACDAGFESSESTEMGGGYRVPCVHAMISLQNNFCLHVHSACKTNYFQLFLHYACSYPVWSYFFLAAPVGYSTRTFAARCSAFPDRQPICLEPQVQQLQQELSDERRERQSALHDEKKEREENDLVILTLGITWQLDWLDWFCWSCTVSALGWWTISLAKFRQRVAPRKTVDSKLTTDARLTWCGWKFMTNLFESTFQILSESCEQKNADRRVWIHLHYANSFANVQTKAHEVMEEKIEEKIASVQLSAPDTSQELVPWICSN